MVKVDTLVKLHVVIQLNRGKTHGYELMKKLEDALQRKISASHIYPFLKELNREKYVAYKENGREKVYHLTSSGKRFVTKILLDFHEIIKESIEKKLTKCTHCGCTVYDNKFKEKVDGKNLAFCCCHCADSYKKGNKHHC